MAKELIYVGLGVVGETVIPEVGKLISFAAQVGEDKYRVNIQGAWQMPRFWEKNQEEWDLMQVDPKPLSEAIGDFAKWLNRYHGNHIAVCSALDFLWIFNHMVGITKKCSFGSTGHLDSRTLHACNTKDYSLKGKRFTEGNLPWEKAEARSKLIQVEEVKGRKEFRFYAPPPPIRGRLVNDPFVAGILQRAGVGAQAQAGAIDRNLAFQVVENAEPAEPNF